MYYKVLLVNILLLVVVYTHQDKTTLETDFYDDGQQEEGNEFSNIWAVQLADGADPDEVARLNGFENKGRILEKKGYYEFVHRSSHLRKRSRRLHEKRVHRSLSNHPYIKWFQQQRYLQREKRSIPPVPILKFNDPQMRYEWYIHNTGDYNTGLEGFDLNILPVWEMGYTGKGVIVSVLDDGLGKYIFQR